jgi:anthranilate phosphoribosyltransferase
MKPLTTAEALEVLCQHENLSAREIYLLFDHLLNTHCDVEWAAILTALAVKDESPEEVAGVVNWLRDHMISITLPEKYEGIVVDCCGTGGDQASTLNISTLAALVASAGNVPIIKHGNRSASGRFGSIDLLEALSIPFAQDPDTAVSLLSQHNVAFLYAPAFHPVLLEVSALRKRLGIHTIFNTAAPLANPAFVQKQLVGVWGSDLVPFVAETLQELGIDRGIVVHGKGLDEFSTLDTNEYAHIKDLDIEFDEYDPRPLGLHAASEEDLVCETPEEYVEKAFKVINGTPCPESDIVALNAGAILYIAEMASSIDDGFCHAQEIILDGSLKKKVEELQNT